MREKINNILASVLSGKEITYQDAVTAYQQADLGELMAVANELKNRLHPHNIVTWQIDRNVNITNVCSTGCKFCNFHCKPHQKEQAFVTSLEEYKPKIELLEKLGGDQLLLQGGMNPELTIEWYEKLFINLKSLYPTIKLHALGAPEVAYLADKANISDAEALGRLVDAGLESLPGAGAEILSERVRKIIAPAKCSSERWLSVMHEAHKMGLLTSATMMYGHVETDEERIEHLMKIRELQNKKTAQQIGFKAFIPWAFQSKGTRLEQDGWAKENNTTEYLRLIAISRIVLHNVENIQASWLTMGVDAGMMALHAGANDMGSIMIEENVVSAAGAQNKLLSPENMKMAISNAGFIPRRRNQAYEFVD